VREELVAVITDFDTMPLNYYEIYKQGEIYSLVIFNRHGRAANELDFDSLGEALAKA
jgi:hypothetical protein